MKKYYVMAIRGRTGIYYCGNIYHRSPSDPIRFDGDEMTFDDIECIGAAITFATEEEAGNYSNCQQSLKDDEDEYARQAEEAEEFGYRDY